MVQLLQNNSNSVELFGSKLFIRFFCTNKFFYLLDRNSNKLNDSKFGS